MLISSGAVGQIAVSSLGTDFWFGFMNGFSPTSDTLKVMISARSTTSGTISIPSVGYSQPFTVAAFSTTSINVPPFQAQVNTSEIIDSLGIHLVANDTVSVFGWNYSPAVSDAAKILPTQSLGNIYRIPCYTDLSASEFLIVATEDNTEVQIVPSAPTAGGNPANVAFSVTLNQGERYQVHSATGMDDFTGSLIVGADTGTACSKPFAVFSGTRCTNIPVGCSACDHIFVQNLPVASWGKTHYTVPFETTTGYTYRVMAHYDNTSFTVNAGPATVLNAGQFFEMNNDTLANCIVSDKEVSVIQYMQGINCGGNGDPAMLLINSEEQRISDITFTTVTSNLLNTHFLNIVVESQFTGQVVLDGTLLNSSLFTAYTACPANSHATVPITVGSHTLDAPDGLTAYVYGMGPAESYAYSVGGVSPVDVDIEDVQCTQDTVTFTSTANISNSWWSSLGNPGDTIGTGQTLVLPPPVLPGVYVIRGFSSSTNCEESYFFQVRGPNPENDVITFSNSDTLCPGDTVTLQAAIMDRIFLDGLDFGIQTSIWDQIQLGAVNTDCGSVSGDALYFNGAGTRQAITNDYDVSDGGEVQFALKIADGAAPCEDADPGEDVVLEYSINGGAGWTNMATLAEDDYPNFTNLEFEIPVLARTTSTRFRWRQLSNSGNNEDNWALDNISLWSINPGLSGVFTYDWSPGGDLDDSTTISPFLTSGNVANFEIEVTDSVGCLYVDSLHLNGSPSLELTMIGDTGICIGDTVTLVTQGGAIFLWEPAEGLSDSSVASPQAFPGTTTTFTLLASDFGGCDTIIDSVVVEVFETPSIGFDNNTILCSGEIVTIVPSNPNATYTWQGNQVADSFSVSEPGLYLVEGANLCDTVQFSISIPGRTPPTVELGNDTILCSEEGFMVDATWPGGFYLWQDGSEQPSFEIAAIGTYWVRVTDEFGCLFTDTIKVVDDCPGTVITPNVFTPNGDGVNDMFIPLLDNVLPDNYSLTVYNRWGQKVFQSEILQNGWDGTTTGLPNPDGTYFWIVKFVQGNGIKGEQNGSLSLIR